MSRAQAYASHDGLGVSEAVSQQMATHGSADTYSSGTASYSRPRRPDYKRKMVCVGDGGCGKTSLLIRYAENAFPMEYVPTVFENYVALKEYGEEKKLVELALWDTAGQEEYDRLRPLSYPESNVIFIVYAIDFPPSLENVEDKWHPEVVHFCENTPIILVGAKCDLRSDQRTLELLAAQGRKPITWQEGEAVAKRIGARYAECSAREGVGVTELFDLALKIALRTGGVSSRLRRRGGVCKIL